MTKSRTTLASRKAFNFYRSYYEVALELPESARLEFLMAIIEMQFTGKERQLKGVAKLAWIGQKHAIEAQIQGFLDKSSSIPTEGGGKGGNEGASQEEKGEEQGEGEGKGKEEVTPLAFDSIEFKNSWIEWVQFRKEKKQKMTPSTIKKQMQFLGARPEAEAIAIINQSITNGWTGLFELKNSNNGTGVNQKTQHTINLAQSVADHYGLAK